jgi:hypothetical protein
MCDCALIPKAWGLPPTSIIIGLGKPLDKHLVAEKQIVEVQRDEAASLQNMKQDALSVS